MNLKELTDFWKNEDEVNNQLHAACTVMVNAHPTLKAHRDWVEAHQFGFGDRPFHWVWHVLVAEMPTDFAFLEVGVFKGQVLSLVALCAKESQKNAVLFGITTLENTPDRRCQYPPGPYRNWIDEIFNTFTLPKEHLTLFVGNSTAPNIVQLAQVHNYHMVYIDAGHNYEDVCQDIKNYAPLVLPGGYLIMDDASIDRLNIGSCWPGLEDVARAVKELLDPDPRFKFLFACGHLNVFYRL